MSYVITNGDLYWSNADGWVSLESADQFTSEEQQSLNLPIGGRWVPVHCGARMCLCDQCDPSHWHCEQCGEGADILTAKPAC